MTMLEKLLFWKAAGGGSKLYQRTIINNPAVFMTEVAEPLKGLSVPFLPVQSGTGDPSPSNVRPISGWTGANATRTGKNLCPRNTMRTSHSGIDYTVTDEGIRVHGTATAGSYSWTSGMDYSTSWLKLPAGTYTFSVTDMFGTNQLDGYIVFMGWDVDGAELSTFTLHNATKTRTVTFAKNVGLYYGMFVKNGLTVDTVVKIQTELGSTATAYEPFVGQTYPISWQSEAGTVYGGTLDALTGVLTVEWASTSVRWGVTTRNPPGESMTSGYIAFEYETKVAGESGVSNEHKCNSAVWMWSGEANTTPHFYVYRGSNGKCTAIVVLPNGTDDDLNIVVASKLKTPYTVQLDPVSLSTLKGENIIWTDTNSDNTIVYLSKTQGGGLGGGLGGGFGSGSDDPGDPENPDDPEIPEEPVTDE